MLYTTNKRFWEFEQDFRKNVQASRAQAIEMECATLFIASYKHRFNLGALLLVSDLPLDKTGIKTKKSSSKVVKERSKHHIETGILALKKANYLIRKKSKGFFKKKHK